MSPDQMAQLLARQRSAADIVEAMDDGAMQLQRGWDFSRWKYQMVPWGVRFLHSAPSGEVSTILAVLSSGIRLATQEGGAPATTTIILLD